MLSAQETQSTAMPPPIRVELFPYSAAWPEIAQREIEQLTHALGTVLSRVHHIGSTAIPGLAAKPIYDLMPVTADITLIDRVLPVFESLGYRSWGELGIAGRRYFTRDTGKGAREAQLHCFQVDSPHVERHLAFRDYLRSHPAIRSAYHHEKKRCASLHSNDSHAYSACKADWIIRAEAEALCWHRNSDTDTP
jgi:GrpB-like predicted nucleotidyltransferase (UPF0157 family)